MAYSLYRIEDDMYDSSRESIANYLNYELAKKNFYKEIEDFDENKLRTSDDGSLHYFLSSQEVLVLEKLHFYDE